MNNTQQTARVGLFFILGLALTWVTFQTLSGRNIFKSKGYTLVVGFESLKELKIGDQVRMAGVEVGAVETIRLDLPHHRAEAILRIEPGIKIAEDSTASIVMAGLIGTNYIGIDLGSPGAAPLAPGAEMRTKVTPDINAIMTQLGNLGGTSQTSFRHPVFGSGAWAVQSMHPYLGPALASKLSEIEQAAVSAMDETIAEFTSG